MNDVIQRRVIGCAVAAAVMGAAMARGQTAEPVEAPHPPAAATQPGGLMDRAAESGAQVYVDDSFASIEKLRTAGRYAGQNQAQLAITTYQSIIDDFGQKLVYLNNDSYMSITDYVRGKLLQLPAVQSGMYDQLFGVEAKKEIDAAIAAHNLPDLMRACDKFFPSAAAFDGLSTAAAWHFEEADFSAAGRIWQELLTHPRAKQARAELLFRAAAAEKLSGDEQGAQALRTQLAAIDDAQGPLLPKLDAVFGVPAWHAPEAAKDEWPGFQGGPTRENLLSVHASIGAQLWNVDLSGGSGEGNGAARSQRMTNRLLAQRRLQPGGTLPDPPLTSYPVLSGGTLFVHTGDRVVALSANAGTFQWSYPEPARSEDLRNEGVAAGFAGRGGVMPIMPAAHDSVSVYGDGAFAVLPVRGGSPTADDEVEDGSAGLGGTQVACLSREDGRLKWSTAARSIKIDGKNDLAFVGSPVVTKQGVFVMARKIGQAAFVQSYIVRMNPENGKVEWSCYLCSASAGMFYGGMGGFTNVPIPSLVDDVLYISTGQGATCAVDANIGRILWLEVTAAAKKGRTPNEFYNPMQGAPSWKFNPPLVWRNKVITLETAAGDQVLSVYDRWNGGLLHSYTAKDLGMTSADVLAGIVGSKLIIEGSQAAALDLEKIEEEASTVWRCEFPADDETGKALGRPFLSEGGLYVPFEKGMALVDVGTGKAGEFWQWPRTEKDASGKPGNLLVTSEQVVVVTETDVAGYSRWETARDNRLGQIQAHPQDPQGYLALAEIAFRTNHLDMADENMKQAVALATAAAPSAAGNDLLGRLYRTNLNFAEQLAAKTESGVRERARLYFEQCRASARTAEQQAEWRLAMSDFSLAQAKPEEAATLFNEVLIDPALRGSTYHHKDATSRAGVTAELKFRALIQEKGSGVYARFEDQAGALLARARNERDAALLQQVVDSYPNSEAASAAARDLAAAYRDKQEWAAEVKTLRWLYPHTEGEAKGPVIADLAMAQLAMKRYTGAIAWAERGLRQYKNLTWKDPASGETVTFATLRDKLRSNGAILAEGRRPVLPPPQADGSAKPAMDNASMTAVFAQGSLLVPLEQSAAFRRPDVLFVASNHQLHVYPVGEAQQHGAGSWFVELPAGGPGGACAVVGSLGDITVVAEARMVCGVNMQTHAVAWQSALGRTVNDGAAANNNGRRVFRQINGGRLIVQGNGRVIINGQLLNAGDIEDVEGQGTQPADPEIARQFAFAHLGRPAFSTMRMIGDKLVIVANGAMSALDVGTGKSAWSDATGAALSVKLPPGVSNIVTGNEELLVVETNDPGSDSSSFFVVDAETGKFRKQIKLDGEHAQWRTVGDDGTLYVVGEQAVSAYDLFADQDQPLWRQSNIQSRFPAATVLTLDGLVLVNSNGEVECLSQEGGEVRWPTPAWGPMRIDIPEPTWLRSAVEGDEVIFQAPQGIVAYASAVQGSAEDQRAWRGEISPGQMPPLDSFQVSEPYVVALGMGPTAAGAQRAVTLFFMARKGGALHLAQPIQRSANAADPEGPLINAWEVVDNGIAMEVGGTVHFYHGKTGG